MRTSKFRETRRCDSWESRNSQSLRFTSRKVTKFLNYERFPESHELAYHQGSQGPITQGVEGSQDAQSSTFFKITKVRYYSYYKRLLLSQKFASLLCNVRLIFHCKWCRKHFFRFFLWEEKVWCTLATVCSKGQPGFQF